MPILSDQHYIVLSYLSFFFYHSFVVYKQLGYVNSGKECFIPIFSNSNFQLYGNKGDAPIVYSNVNCHGWENTH